MTAFRAALPRCSLAVGLLWLALAAAIPIAGCRGRGSTPVVVQTDIPPGQETQKVYVSSPGQYMSISGPLKGSADAVEVASVKPYVQNRKARPVMKARGWAKRSDATHYRIWVSFTIKRIKAPTMMSWIVTLKRAD